MDVLNSSFLMKRELTDIGFDHDAHVLHKEFWDLHGVRNCSESSVTCVPVRTDTVCEFKDVSKSVKKMPLKKKRSKLIHFLKKIMRI